MSQKSTTSTRFANAARAESERLARRQDRAAERVSRLENELRQARGELVALTDRLEQLSVLAGEAPPREPEREIVKDGIAVKGAEIRRRAVEALRESAEVNHPIHYRDWLRILEDMGFRVEGKRPDAVFLGQVVRSPVVRGTTQAGFYVLDFEAPERLRKEISAAEHESHALSQLRPQSADELDEVNERREKIGATLRALGRELSEALSVLGETGSSVASIRRAA